MTFIQEKVEKLFSGMSKFDKTTKDDLLEALTEVDKQAHERGVEEGKRMESERLNRIVREEMDKMMFYTNEQFIVCDELTIRIVKALTPPETEPCGCDVHESCSQHRTEEAPKTATP